MRDQAPARREEMRLIKAYQRVVLGGGFPNPERAGCPGNEILRAMAFRKLGVDQVNDWIEHLGTCSPCFREYTELRRAGGVAKACGIPKHRSRRHLQFYLSAGGGGDQVSRL